MNESNLRLKVLDGEISQLYTKGMSVHYLKNIRQKQAFAGKVAVLQAVMGEAGAVNSAQAANDEGDPVVGFSMQVAGKTVLGSFWSATFKDGDCIKVIGHERNKVFEAVAVAKTDDRIIWMQPHCERGTAAQKNILLRRSCWFLIFMCLCALLVSAYEGWPLWVSLVAFFASSLIILVCTVGMSWKDFMSFSREMDNVGEALNLPNPENIDLFNSTKLARKKGRSDLPMGVYYY